MNDKENKNNNKVEDNAAEEIKEHPFDENENVTTDDINIEALEKLGDIPVEVAVELGRKRITLDQLLSLKSGSIVELVKVSGDPLDIIVGEKLIARGEAIVIGDRYGVRITEVIMDNKNIKPEVTGED